MKGFQNGFKTKLISVLNKQIYLNVNKYELNANLNQKPIIDILKTKQKEHKYNTKVIRQQGKRLKDRKKQKRTTKTTPKQVTKWQ